MKKYTLILTILAVLVAFSIKAQVAINDDGSDAHSSAILDIDANNKGVSFPNVSISEVYIMSEFFPIFHPKIGLVVYNTNTTTGPGLFMWTGIPTGTPPVPDGLGWVNLSQQTTSSSGSFESVSLATDRVINNSSWTDIPGTFLTFIAENSNVLINMTASGYASGTFLSSSSVKLRVENTGTVIGGTSTQISPPFSWTGIAEWSVSFSKVMSGLTPGHSYTINVEGIGSGANVYIRASSNTSTDHLTLSIIQ